LKDLPELETVLKEGLPAVTFNALLYEAARAHTQDMFINGYYSHDSPDGQGYDARIRNSGYPAVATGESLGMLIFANFIDPGDAVKRLFEYMFRDELDPSRTEKRNILDPLLKEVGISIDTGVLSLGGALWNVYLATCDYGAYISGPEARLLQRINQARENPLKVAASLGLDPERLLADFPEWQQDLLTQGLPPLTTNLKLYKAARAHAEDMLANGYFSSDSLDGRTVKDRIQETGYDPQNVGEYIRIQCLGNDFTNDDDMIDRMVGIIFELFLTREFSPYYAGQRNILNAGLNEVGISLITGTSDTLGGICGNSVLLMVADFGLRSE
ncbi:MAG: CAP domain-containing protein, partial [Deltaproteobacteria bacterium]|nr:CAP domain-containing protein [Deltaproteobacteria bacterium]